MFHKIHMLNSQPQNVTVFGDVFREVIKVNEVTEVSPHLIGLVSLEEEEIWTQGETSDTCTHREMTSWRDS